MRLFKVMRILSLSYLDIWPHGEGKGIPSIFFSQKGLADRGHEVHFICPSWRGQPGDSLYQGVHIHRVRLPFGITRLLAGKPIRMDRFFSHLKAFFLVNLTWFFFQLWGLGAVLRVAFKVRPHVVYSHDLTPAFIAWLVSRLFKTKFILRLYGTRHLYWYYRSMVLRIKECRDYLALRLPADYYIITKDGTNADLLAKELGAKEEKIRHWRNGVDFGLYSPSLEVKGRVCRQLGIPEDRKIIISTSRLIGFYQVDRFIFRLPEILRLIPGCACIIASDGPEKERFCEFVRQNNIEDKVFFVGMVDRERLKDLLNASDLFINLTSYSNCNNALFEAMVTGKCIVATENRSTSDLIDSGANGYLIRENELDYLPATLCRLLMDEEMLNRFKMRARETALQKLWTWDERMDEEANLLKTLE